MEESPDSKERCTSEREDVRKGIGAEKRMTAPVKNYVNLTV